MPTFEDNNFSLFSNTDETMKAEFRIQGTTGTRQLYGLQNTGTVAPTVNPIAITTVPNEWVSGQVFTSYILINLNEGTSVGNDTPLQIYADELQAENIMEVQDAVSSKVFVLNKNGHIPTNAFTMVDHTDISKELIWDLSSITTLTGRTLKVPDANIVIAGSEAALTSGRVPVVTTGGLLVDDADLTFATDTLTATKIKAGSAAGYISSDGSTGATGSFTTTDGKTVTVKDGIITAIV